MVKRFISYFKPYKKLFFLDLGAAVLVGAIDLVYPNLTRNMLNDYIQNDNIRAVVISAIVLIFLYILKMGLNFFMGYQGHNMAADMQKDMRRDLFSQFEKLPIRYFDNNKTGVLISRTTSDLQEVSELAHHGPEDLLTSFIVFAGAVFFMVRMNLVLSLIVIACIPPIVFIVSKVRTKMDAAMREGRAKIGEMSAVLENSFTGIRVSKAYDAATEEEKHFAESNEQYYKARHQVNLMLGIFNSVMNFCNDFLYWIVLLIGGIFVIVSKETVGSFADLTYVDLVTFMLYVNVFLQPLRKLAGFIEQYQSGMSGFRRFDEIMNEQVEEDDPGATVLEKAEGEIVFDNVQFAYNDKKEILSGVSFRVKKGKTLALVGPTGGGKSTICHLIPRFYEVTGGEILLDGKDIRGYTRASLRQNVGIVAQDLFLFDASIYDNIAYGRPTATREEVTEAARLANLSDFLASLPEGIDTMVGERGVRLSGGQKQRVSIARAFLKNPPILILDEATSALDTVTENMIQESLTKLSEGRTVIVVAHRLSTVRKADEILVVDEKGISERGSHEELIRQNGEYASLCRAAEGLDKTMA